MLDHPIWARRKPSFGFVSTRLAGTDGVSLETQKWVDVIAEQGCPCYFLAGELDTDPEVSQLVPEAHFQHPDVLAIQEALFERKERNAETSANVQSLKEHLKRELERFHERFGFEFLVVQNALAIPMNVPLGLALTEFIAENDVAVIAHHHDFYWERQRFHSDAASDYLRAAFPPAHPRIQHVVINSIAGKELALRTGESSMLVPNVLDFKVLPPGPDAHSADFREQIDLAEDAMLVLQPTRLVSRKGIETAVEIVKRLDAERGALVITHDAGDEGMEYENRVREYADFLGVELRLVADRIAQERGHDGDGKLFTLWDAYPHADLVTYPSIYEGYGNAFVEAIYFRKPVLVNRYPIFEVDIEPKGFDVVAFSDFVTEQAIADVRALLGDRKRLLDMAETNYMLGWRYLSYEMLEEKLEQLMINYYGSR